MHRVHTETLTKAEKRQLWDDIVSDYLVSQQSVRHYSETHGLKSDHLSYYVSSYKRKQKEASNAFVPIQLPAAPTTIDIHAGKLCVCVPMSTPKSVLETLLSALTDLC